MSILIQPEPTQRQPGVRFRWVLLLLAATAALQCLFWTGTIASDDLAYLREACEFDGRRVADPSYQIVYARIGFWYPLRMTTWIIGQSWHALVPTPFVATLGTLLCVWVLASRCFDRRTALIAVAALGLTPYCLISATIGLPDVVCGLFMIAGLAAGAPALIEKNARRRWWRCLLAGFLIGVGYSAKEYSVLMLPAIGLFVLVFRTRCGWAWARFATVCLGALAWLGVEGLAMWRLTGDPLFHYHVITSSQRAWGNPIGEITIKTLYWYWTGIPRWLVNPESHFGWWGPVYVAGMILALLHRSAAAWLVLCCLTAQGLYQCVGTVDLTSYWPMWHQPRYLIPLFPLGAVLIGHAASRLWGPSPPGRAAGRLVRARRVVLVAVAAFLVHQSIVLANRECRRWGASSTFFAARKLLRQPEPPWPSDARMCASSQTRMRLGLPVAEAGLQPLEKVYPDGPETPQQWQRRYGGRYVWVSKADRQPTHHTYKGILNEASLVALGRLQRVARVTPPADRLNQILAWLKLTQPRYAEDAAVEVYYVPPPADTQAEDTIR